MAPKFFNIPLKGRLYPLFILFPTGVCKAFNSHLIFFKVQKLVKLLPLERICLETDSPALGPEKQVNVEEEGLLCMYIQTDSLCRSGTGTAELNSVSMDTKREKR